MNVPYNFAKMNHQEGFDDKKPYPLMYGTPQGSPGGYNLGTPLPPLSSLSRVMTNNSMIAPSPLNMAQYGQMPPFQQSPYEFHDGHFLDNVRLGKQMSPHQMQNNGGPVQDHHQRLLQQQQLQSQLQGQQLNLQNQHLKMAPHGYVNNGMGRNGPSMQALQAMQMQRNPNFQTQPFQPEHSLSNQNALRIASKLLSPSAEDGLKKKRGRPKKLILDPSTNQYIDSSHENFKKLNKILKQTMESAEPKDSAFGKHTKLDIMNDQAIKQLLELKDRRGRPRKFPIEQTGITIKGIRVSGTMKGRRKDPMANADKVQKKKRGRPKRDVEVELSTSA